MDRKYMPENVKVANLKKREITAMYSEWVMVGKWEDKHFVSYISTEHKNEMER